MKTYIILFSLITTSFACDSSNSKNKPDATARENPIGSKAVDQAQGENQVDQTTNGTEQGGTADPSEPDVEGTDAVTGGRGGESEPDPSGANPDDNNFTIVRYNFIWDDDENKENGFYSVAVQLLNTYKTKVSYLFGYEFEALSYKDSRATTVDMTIFPELLEGLIEESKELANGAFTIKYEENSYAGCEHPLSDITPDELHISYQYDNDSNTFSEDLVKTRYQISDGCKIIESGNYVKQPYIQSAQEMELGLLFIGEVAMGGSTIVE